jgi:hypothetical protein
MGESIQLCSGLSLIETIADYQDRVVAQVVLSKGEKGAYQSISWGWGYGILPTSPVA